VGSARDSTRDSPAGGVYSNRRELSSVIIGIQYSSQELDFVVTLANAYSIAFVLRLTLQRFSTPAIYVLDVTDHYHNELKLLLIFTSKYSSKVISNSF